MISMPPKISIIIPSYNEEKNISRCLDSVLNQTFTDFEVLCVDDGSTDKTFDIIKKYSEKDGRIIPLKNPEKGVSSARNFGIDNSKGEYIGFVDSDDFIPENFISFTDSEFNSNNELIFSSACTKLILKKFLGETRFEKFKIGEDTVFNSEIYSNSNSYIFVNSELYTYYVNTESVSFTELWHEKWFDLLETRFISYDLLKGKNETLSSFYLERGMKFLLSYRFNLKGSPNEKRFKKPLKKFFKKYILPFMKCKSISYKNKLTIPVFFLIPPLYKLFRKMTDKTL